MDGQSKIEATLAHGGLAADDHFIVDGGVFFWAYLGESPMTFLLHIEDGALNKACVEYLRGRGVREYASIRDVPPLEKSS